MNWRSFFDKGNAIKRTKLGKLGGAWHRHAQPKPSCAILPGNGTAFFRHPGYHLNAFPQPFAENHLSVLFLCGNIQHDTPRNSSSRACKCLPRVQPRGQSPLACPLWRALHEVPHLQLARLVSIYPLSFLHLAHSLAQWMFHNSFRFKRFRTLSIATEV